MNSYCSEEYWDQYNALPRDVRKVAKRNFRLWLKDSSAESLYFKLVHKKRKWWSVRAAPGIRAVAQKDGDDFIWFFIGSHDDYMRLIK